VACDRFIYIEILKKPESATSADSKDTPTSKSGVEKITPKDLRFIATTIDDVSDDDGWAFMGDVGSLLQKKQPNFDSRNYGFQKLTPLLSSIPHFEIDRREDSKGRKKLVYVKIKEKQRTGRMKK